MKEIKSPCISKCCLNKEDVCMGCLRTLTEITGWSAAGEKEKKEIIERIKQGTSAMPVIIQGETE